MGDAEETRQVLAAKFLASSRTWTSGSGGW
jgi:hypothetical protein